MSLPPDQFPDPQYANQSDTNNVQIPVGKVDVTHRPDGSGIMQLPGNGTIERDANGNFNVKFLRIKRVEIADITTVISHQVNRLLNSTSHVIHFSGGGVFTIGYDQHGTLLHSLSRKVVCSFTDDGVIRLERSFQENDRNRVTFGGKEL